MFVCMYVCMYTFGPIACSNLAELTICEQNCYETLCLQCYQLSDVYLCYPATLGYILSPSVYLRFYLELHFVKAAYFSRGVCLVSTFLRPGPARSVMLVRSSVHSSAQRTAILKRSLFEPRPQVLSTGKLLTLEHCPS